MPITAKIIRPMARTSPVCVTNRRPQTSRITGIPQAPLPLMMTSVDAAAAPTRPSALRAGSSVATIQPGSSGV